MLTRALYWQVKNPLMKVACAAISGDGQMLAVDEPMMATTDVAQA